MYKMLINAQNSNTTHALKYIIAIQLITYYFVGFCRSFLLISHLQIEDTSILLVIQCLISKFLILYILFLFAVIFDCSV